MVNNLFRTIKNLKAEIKLEVNSKLKEFESGMNKSPEEKFLELSFCILVANTSLEKTLVVWNKIGREFLSAPEGKLRKKLKILGYRFYNKRTDYIVLARSFIKDIDFTLREKSSHEAREWLVKNIKGIGWKEASHFLRNLGFKNFAILDRHVLRLVNENKIINGIPHSLSGKRYLETEGKLKDIANRLGVTLAELDLYLFYLDTGRICRK